MILTREARRSRRWATRLGLEPLVLEGQPSRYRDLFGKVRIVEKPGPVRDQPDLPTFTNQ